MPYEIISATGSGTWDWTAAGEPATIDVLLVGGGGGGGGVNTETGAGGGGGAGGVLVLTNYAVTGSVNYIVGAGGTGQISGQGGDGGDTEFPFNSANVSDGGGGGGYATFNTASGGRNGGSGGGGAGTRLGEGNTGGTATGNGTGSDGGDGSATGGFSSNVPEDSHGGGGGGYSSVGAAATTSAPGSGGSGVSLATLGFYPATSELPATIAVGGAGGGATESGDASDAVASSGSGGEGQNRLGSVAGDGADGFIVIRYGEEPQYGEGRVRSSVSEDAGSILDSASLNAVDASFSEAFLLDTSLTPTTQQEFREALAPATVAAQYYPVPRQSTEFLNDYSGETLLSRMARVYPPPIFDEVSELGLTTFVWDDGSGTKIKDVATAQTVISYIFSEWATAYSWFTYATVPDLRSKVVDDGTNGGDGIGVKAPSEYEVNDPPTAEDDGLVYTAVIQILQDEDNRKTMRQILDELLSPFPGTVVRANASGALEIVPAYGPDASNTAAVTLTEKDAYTVTTGQPSPKGIVNKWTFTSQPYVATEDGGLLNQSWFQFAGYDFPNDELYTDLDSTGVNISSDDPYPGSGKPSEWSPQSGRIPVSGTGIKLTDSLGVKQVTADYKREGQASQSFDLSSITLTDIPLSGEWVRAIQITESVAGFTPILGVGSSSIYLNVDARYVAETRSVQFRLPSDQKLRAGITPADYSIRVNLFDATDVWQAETTRVTGTYDLTEETENANPLPGNPVATSVAAYGEREKRVDITGWGITDASRLADMAKAAVLEAIEPKLIRTVEQSVWRAFPVKWSHMGSVIALPSGEEGRLTTRTYADDFGTNFGPGSMSSTLKIEVLDADGSGVIDTTTDYLLLDDGTAFVLDDGTQAEGG